MADALTPAAPGSHRAPPVPDPTSATLTLARANAGEPSRHTGVATDTQPALVACLGTRPEIIKMAPVCRALRAAGLPLRVLHTGQHRELAASMYTALDLIPDHALPLVRENDSIAALAAGLIQAIDPVLTHWRPAALLVHGDTSSAAMAALAGFWRGIPVAHVEAGLRSHQARDPFPEEMNRTLIARVANWHFTPTPAAVANLRAEGIAGRGVFQVGNTIVDATLQALERLGAVNPLAAARPGARLIVVTAHRRENWGAPIQGFIRALGAVLSAHADLEVVWTLHANPVLAGDVRAVHASLPPEPASRLHLVPPLDYLRMISLLQAAWLVLTDSGGIQEEACALRVPVLVLRHTTERPELIEAGAGRLIGTDPLRVAAEVERLWREPALHRAMRAVQNPFGDGMASQRIATVLSQWYFAGRRRAAPVPGEAAPTTARRRGRAVAAPGSVGVMAAPDLLFEAIGSLAAYHALLQGALTALALIYLLSGVDDLFIDAVYWLRALRRATWRRHRIRHIAPDALAARPEQPIAIMIPAWDESAVLEPMLARLIQTIDYQRYRVYVGVYPNDTATRLAVGRAAAADSRIRTVVLDHDGPTVKADCLNGIWRAIARDEAAQGEPFAIYVMQDCEDVIDPLACRLFNWLIPRKDMVQLPVLSLPRRWWQFTGAHYLDEFAQQHLKDLVVREVLGRGLPAAGVGVAFSRRALQALAQTDPDGGPFRTDSLTEDYDLGLRLQALGYRQIFARFWVTRTHVALDPRSGAVRPERRRELVCVREYFPSTLRAAVRQKARWVVGIALQGWRTWGWRGDWTVRYLLMRDRKVLLMSLVAIAAYGVFFLMAMHWAWNWMQTGRLEAPALRDPGIWLPALLIANLALLGLRALQRAVCTGLLYGPVEALLSLPRMVWASVINILATLRALRLWLRHLATGQPIGWDKTVHQFPDAVPLAVVKSVADPSEGAAVRASGPSLDVDVEHPPRSAGRPAGGRPAVPFSTNEGARP